MEIETRDGITCSIDLYMLQPTSHLSPKYFYGENFSTHPEVRRGLYERMARMIPNVAERAQDDVDLDAYRNNLGEFGTWH